MHLVVTNSGGCHVVVSLFQVLVLQRSHVFVRDFLFEKEDIVVGLDFPCIKKYYSYKQQNVLNR